MMRSLSIRSKLLAMMLLSSILCLAVGGWVADRRGTAALESAVFNQLTSVREDKRAHVEDYADEMQRVVRMLSQTPAVLRGMSEFSEAFRQLDAAGPEPPSPELIRFYQNDFLPRLARVSNGSPSLTSYLPAGGAARQLQTDYLARNPNGFDEKAKLVDAGGGTAYDAAHNSLHPFYQVALREYHIDDIVLIDATTADVVYSVIKQPDFATNLRNGPYSRSGLARVFERALDMHDLGAVAFEPFSAYPPAGLAPTGFLASPLLRNGVTIGVVVVQLSIEDIDRVMSSGRHWAEIGLGRTGSAYLVGSDGRALSDDREIIENKPGFLKALAAAGVDPEIIHRVDIFNTMVMNLPIDTEASRAALGGRSGTGIIRDYQDVPVLSSWAPINLGGVRWAVIAEMDAAEAFAPQVQFRNTLLLVAAVAAILLTLTTLFWANAFVRPIREILAGVKALDRGDDTVRISVEGHDEFSELAGAFNEMAEEIALRNARIEAKSAEYEALLKNVYPDVVAERIKLGQTEIAEYVRNVTVIVLNLGGVDRLIESKQHSTVTVINEFVDALDDAAERTGVEKLKTIGESYLAACGLVTPRLDHAARAVAFAAEACRILERFRRAWHLPLDLHVGIASGDVEAGLVGRQRTVYDLISVTMLTARRIAFEAAPNAIRITVATHHLLGEAPEFEPRPLIESPLLGEIATYERAVLARAGVEG
jgi:class 3 adenylate cyclase